MYRWSLLICKRWNPKYIWHLDKCQMFSLCTRFKIEMRKVKKKKKSKRQANRLLWFWCCCFSSNRGFLKAKWDSHCILECWPYYALPIAISRKEAHSSRKEENTGLEVSWEAWVPCTATARLALGKSLYLPHLQHPHIQMSVGHKCMLRETQRAKQWVKQTNNHSTGKHFACMFNT